MDINELVSQFWQICRDAKTIESTADGPDEFEPQILQILKLVQSYSEFNTTWKACFIELLYLPEKGPQEIAELCIRVLKWDEVRQAAIYRILANTDHRIKRRMEIFLEVFEHEWEDEELYSYFNNR